MELLKEIFDAPIGTNKPTTREAARAILFDDNNMIPLLFVSKYNYHKLPGGGIENGEDIQKALAREILEEVGCEATIDSEVGKVIEYKSAWNKLQTSYCFIGTITKKGEPKFTDKELAEGFQMVRMSLDDAIATVKNDTPESYAGQSHQPRDLAFLEKTREILSAKK